MSNTLIAMSKVRKILHSHALKTGKKTISRKTGVTRNTVKRYIRQYIALNRPLEEILKLSDKELEKLFSAKSYYEPTPRQRELMKLFPTMDKKIKKGATRLALWEEYIKDHPEGYRYSQFKHLYRQWSKRVNSTMHVEHKAGDKMYVDYTGKKLQIADLQTGELRQVEVFVAILGASQLTYVEATMTQQKEDFIGGCENALLYFEGAPQAIVTDNLKAAVTRSNRYEPTLNESFRDFVEHYGMTALPAGPYKPRHKALVEGAVKIIYQTIYMVVNQRQYTSLDQLNKAIKQALEEHNNRLLKGRPYSRRQLFEEIERKELQPLASFRYELKRKRTATVMKNNYICLGEDKHYYSVPYRYIGKKVNILYSQTQVDIYYRNEHIAAHKRNPRPFTYTTVEDHLASKHRFKSDWTPEKFIERAEVIGEDTKAYIIEILGKRQHPEQAYKSCQGILNYVAKVGDERLNAACRRANYYGDYSYKTIIAILEKRMEFADLDEENDNGATPSHINIRGNIYYA